MGRSAHRVLLRVLVATPLGLCVGLGAPGEALSQCKPTAALVTEAGSGELSQVDLATGAIRRIASGLGSPYGLAVHPDGSTAFFIKHRAGELWAVELSTGSLTRVTPALKGGPFGVAVNAAGSRAYVTEFAYGRLSAVDLAGGSVSTVATGLSAPYGVAVGQADTTAYVTEIASGDLSAVDLATGAVAAVATGLEGPHGVALSSDGATAFLTLSPRGELAAVDLRTGKVQALSAAWDSPCAVAVDVAGSAAYLTNFVTGELSRFDFDISRVSSVASGLSTPAGLALLSPDCPSNRPPRAVAGPDSRAECTSPEGAPVLLDGSSSSDPDSTEGTNNDIVSFEWFEDFGLPSETFLGTGQILEATFPLGTHAVTLRVTDSDGQTDADEVVVAVVDSTPPGLSLALFPAVLWPPDHRQVDVQARVEAHDACSTPVPLLVSVASSEPDDASGLGDGQTLNDIEATEPGSADFLFRLRAERSGNGAGRWYTVTYQATDEAGNSTSAAAFVLVPRGLGSATKR